MIRPAAFHLSALALVLAAVSPSAVHAQPVIPGLAGFGVETRAAYGGGVDPTIIIVDTLDPYASLTDATRAGVAVLVGGFKSALDLDQDNKVILFEVSGWIEVTGSDRRAFRVRNRYVTIAGQSAPSPGVGLKGVPLRIAREHVLVQHLRVVPGAHTDDWPTATGGLSVGPFSDWPKPHDVVVDHCTVGWQMDDNGVGQGPVDIDLAPHDITVVNTIYFEGLHNPPAMPTNDGKGCLLGSVKNLLFARNLMHSNYYRNPVYSYGCNEVIQDNNLIYNPVDFNSSFQSANSCPNGRWSLVGNVVVPGPNTGSTAATTFPDFKGTTELTHLVHLEDNRVGDYTQLSASDWSHVRFWDSATVSFDTIGATTSPITYPTGYAPLASSVTPAHVLAHAGSRPADRSTLEQRIIDEASSGGSLGSAFVSDPTHPDIPANVRNLVTDMASEGLDPLPATPHADDDDDGYTNLEEWLHCLAATVEGDGCAGEGGAGGAAGAGAGGAGGSGGAGHTAGAGGSAGHLSPNEADDTAEGGCSCRIQPARGTSNWGWLVALMTLCATVGARSSGSAARCRKRPTS